MMGQKLNKVFMMQVTEIFYWEMEKVVLTFHQIKYMGYGQVNRQEMLLKLNWQMEKQ